MGLLELEVIAPAARWASAAAAAPDLQRYSVPSASRASLPFVLDTSLDRQIAFDLLQQRGVPRLQAGQPPPEDDNTLEHLSTLPYTQGCSSAKSNFLRDCITIILHKKPRLRPLVAWSPFRNRPNTRFLGPNLSMNSRPTSKHPVMESVVFRQEPKAKQSCTHSCINING